MRETATLNVWSCENKGRNSEKDNTKSKYPIKEIALRDGNQVDAHLVI